MLTTQPYFRTGLIVILTICLLLSGLQCSKSGTDDGTKFILQNPKILIKNVVSNYVIAPKFDTRAETIIFNGRLDGDSWDCIYTIPAEGGDYQKIIEDTDNLLYPSFSEDGSKIIYTRGFARQIHLFDIGSGQKTALPIFGNNPILLPDDETVLYSGVIDANLKVYHIPSMQSKNITESYISANFSPVLLTDQHNIHWIEKRKDGRNFLNYTDLESVEPVPYFTQSRLIRSITASPSGDWILANFDNGSLLAVHPADTATAQVVIQSEDDKADPQVYLPDWAISGNILVCTATDGGQGKTRNPFFSRGYFSADLLTMDVSWEDLRNSEITQTRVPASVQLFEEVESVEEILARQAARNNNPPQIISDPPETVMQGDLYIYRINTVDIDQFDELEYRQIAGPASAEILPKSGIFYFPANTPGDFNFTIAVEDDKGMQDIQNFTVTVLPKPDWANTRATPPPRPERTCEYIAGLVFKDPNQDGLLSPGENASLLIDLRTRSLSIDSVKLQILTTVGSGEIEMDDELVFEHCVPNRWSRKIVPIKGLSGLQNRPIVIRGILQDDQGIDVLPASLVISAMNPAAP